MSHDSLLYWIYLYSVAFVGLMQLSIWAAKAFFWAFDKAVYALFGQHLKGYGG